MRKTIVYYTCNTHKPEIDELCRKQLLKGIGEKIKGKYFEKQWRFADDFGFSKTNKIR